MMLDLTSAVIVSEATDTEIGSIPGGIRGGILPSALESTAHLSLNIQPDVRT